MKKDIGLLWFRNDLRLHDNEALDRVLESTESFLPVYVFDPRLINGDEENGLPGMFETRIQFLLESVHDLRNQLRALGSDLIVRTGEPESVLYYLAREYQVGGVFCNRERMPHENAVQERLEQRLWTLGLEMHFFRGKMLYYTSDLPFPVPRTPENFASFLKETEHFIPVREPIPGVYASLPFPDIQIDPGEIPTLSDFGYPDTYSNPVFKGGETVGKQALIDNVVRVSETGDSHLGISPWVSMGNLSPKDVYHTITEADGIDPTIRRSITRNLILRDFYRLTGKKEPYSLFAMGGFRNQPEHSGQWDWSALQQWITGHTGHEYVDACMKCLATTGYLTHKQRKAVAYYLLDKMQVHWLMGAGYFERVLLDYDPCSNYVNWQRVAGLSPDLKGRQGLNFDLLADQEDPTGTFRQKWSGVIVPKDASNIQLEGLNKLEN